jgi:hypothetical protein
MNYIVSIGKFNIIPNVPDNNEITIIKRNVPSILHEIECGDYIRDLINYKNFTSPVLSWDDMPTKYILLTYENVGSDIIQYMNADISTMVLVCKNILNFLRTNHIIHTDINIKTVRMNKYSTHPILINFARAIIHNRYSVPEYIPAHHWKSPLYHLFCYIVNSKNDKLTHDVASDIISHISATSFGLSLPIQYVTTVEERIRCYINKTRNEIIVELLGKSPDWDIYSMHAMIYEYTEECEIHSKCKQYIIDRSTSIF